MRECPSLPTDEIACWWEETKISTQLRLAASACVLTTALFIGSAGGAIAAADTETASAGTSTTQSASEGAAVANAPTTVASPTNKPISQLSSTIQSVLQKLRSLGKPPVTPVAVKPTTDPLVATDASADNTESSEATPAAITTDTAETDENAAVGNPNPTPLNHNFAASATPGGPPPPGKLLAAELEALRPVTNAVATVAGVALTVPGVLAGLPGSKDPLGDVITSLQSMLIAVNDAVVPLAQVPGDLYSLMVAGLAATPVKTVGVSSRPSVSAAAGAGLTPPPTPSGGSILPISPGGNLPLLGDVIAPATLGGIAAAGLSADLTLSGTAPLAVGGAGPAGALSFLEHTVKAVLAPASLTALAAFALPGIAGLLIICGAGMRLGYRQAKAALAVRTSAISRFARQGPLGVVRSGSLVALHTRHPRALRVVRPSVSRVTPLFEQAA